MLDWDADSPIPFHPDGHTVQDYEKRFQMEDAGLIDNSKRFLLNMVEEAIQIGG